MLLGEIDRELVDNLTCVACQCTKERAVTIHDDEPELRIRFEEFRERLGVELVVAKIERSIMDERY
jgi:hypothetical protein